MVSTPSAIGDASAETLGDILFRALEQLTATGRVNVACNLACAATRGCNATQWKRFNKLLHRLRTHVQEPGHLLIHLAQRVIG